jgi:cardiolipin synthase A/B
MTMRVHPLATIVIFLAALVLTYFVWSRMRRKRIDLLLPADYDLSSLFRSMAALTWGHVTEGNRVTIVQNSGFFDAMLDDAARATHSIHLETFLWRGSAISERMTATLCARASDGIEVRVLVDQRGAKKTPPETWARLRAAGVDFRVYHRMRFREFARYNQRDHRKIVVIDGRIGYTFGHGIDDTWGGNADQPDGWRDTGARFEGPVVSELQAAFFDNWAVTTGRLPAGDAYFPALPDAGDTPVFVAYIQQSETPSAVQRLYYFAIAAAKREIILQNPYFLPDRQAGKLFTEAVRRGVQISIMLPASETNDFPIVQHASHFYYGPLLAMGVRVYEHTRCGLHQKLMIVDGELCTIGSANFDPRSFRINEEISVAILDKKIAAELRAAFDADVQNSESWTIDRWRARTIGHKLRDRLSALCKREL